MRGDRALVWCLLMSMSVCLSVSLSVHQIISTVQKIHHPSAEARELYSLLNSPHVQVSKLKHLYLSFSVTCTCLSLCHLYLSLSLSPVHVSLSVTSLSQCTNSCTCLSLSLSVTCTCLSGPPLIPRQCGPVRLWTCFTSSAWWDAWWWGGHEDCLSGEEQPATGETKWHCSRGESV